MLTFVAASTVSAQNPSQSPNTITAAVPSTRVGDLLVAVFGGSDLTQTTISAPPGWTQVAVPTALASSGTLVHSLVAYTHVVATGDPASVSFTFAASPAYNANPALVLLAYTGGLLAATRWAAVSGNSAPSVQVPASSTRVLEIAGTPPTSQYSLNGATSATALSGGTAATYQSAFVLQVDEYAAQAGPTQSVVWHASPSDGYVYGCAVLALLEQGPPLQPVLGPPGPSAYVDLSGTPAFGWSPQPVAPANTPTAYALRRKTGSGAYQWWSGSAWQATEVFVVSTATSVTFPVTSWSNGTAYAWSVATRDQGGTSPYAADVTVTGSAPPAVTVTAPAGNLGQSTSPQVTWSTTVQPGAVQTGYRVVVYEAAQYQAAGFQPGAGLSDFDTGAVSGAAQQTTVGPLPNGRGYRVYVQATETGGQTSPWAFSAFTLSLTTPAAPSVAAVWDEPTARTVVTVTDSASSGFGQLMAQVFRDGTPVRGGSVPIQPGGQVTVTDWEALPLAAHVYSAAVTGSSQGYQLTGPAGQAAPVVASLHRWWLKDPLSPAANLPVNPQGKATTVLTERSTAYTPIGATYPLVVSDSVSGDDGGATWLTTGEPEWQALRVLLRRQATLLLQSPFGAQWYVRLMGPRATDLEASSPAAPYRTTQVAWLEVGAP